MKYKGFIFGIGTITLLGLLFVGGRLPYFMFYFLFALILIPFIHGFYGTKKILIKMDVPAKDMIAGEEISIRTLFHNPSGTLFPYLSFKRSLANLIGHTNLAHINFHLGPDEKYQDVTTVKCQRRGVYIVGETHLEIKDIFGLFTFKKKLEAPIELKIYPKITPLETFNLEAGFQMGSFIVEDPLFQDYSAIDSLRAYREGDSYKRIHWRASAKQNTIIIKDFEHRGEAKVNIIMDQEALKYKSDAHRLLEDKIVDITTSIVYYTLSEHLETTLITQKNETSQISKGNNLQYMKGFLDQLVSFTPDVNTSLYQTLNQLRAYFTQGTTLILVSPKLDAKLASTVLDLKMSNLRPMLILVSPSKENSLSDEEIAHVNKLKLEGLTITHLSLTP